MKKEDLPTSELLKMIDSFEHYPAVTDADDRGYILAYLDDEACSISEDEIKEYLDAIVITKDNIHLYYEFMSDEDIESHRKILALIFNERVKITLNHLNQQDRLNLSRFDILFLWSSDKLIIGSWMFGIKDTLKPIDEYIAEIKASEEYKGYVASR